MQREIVTTSDGSSTIFFSEWKEHCHSIHGAIQEANHVFIKMGLSLFSSGEVAILEIGFGTGLNAFITLLEAEKRNLTISYVGVEAYPITLEEVEKLNYPKQLNASEEIFRLLHEKPWEQNIEISSRFNLKKRQQFFEQINDASQYDLIYFDAFGAGVQPELWTVSIFKKMYQALKPKGVLVTYAAKGSVRRAMLEVGFKVERLPGPPGKREMLRATVG
ncbi:MAG: SAM-dependent methyltransferase [Flavobacteriaceae bacterium CG_4_8_14_3_um_filter_34_10]|nr:tRNA (5-methylaminomethyl-2-thiouridine)(34)-methyltransferase MnmD [Flavobacteriia bacterium]OIP49838.1 MAG: SAM-dependent methyltransferase [Flavobacteriaceae bacterium CG2_30_34_30]PIQ18902.1 MAG: SAM-dependent methyltransferase [Flavobacteriaceae bacterium CG18_big_fil_WC_8_21_14_2_50_34_36]PIV48955.1 MAG: SAM-dependent methyltransferase [Flavobacteriaceae bacterium CG02_land_8_20_14_3_00_34_13]PIX10460.1 MAG: SAM-dependent methyltransferase [Flavobacteriaceae bacterium CG_4_8_14_3_um_fi